MDATNDVSFGVGPLPRPCGLCSCSGCDWDAGLHELINVTQASEDCFDALIACLVARASMLALCEPIPDTDRESARREGWIAPSLPGSLQHLAS